MNKYSSLVNYNKPTRPKRLRLRTIIKRVVVLGCLLVFIFVAAKGCVRLFSSFAADPTPKAVLAKAAVWGRQFQCRALVVREEMVVVAPQSGVLNVIAEPMTKVVNGELVAELVDQELLLDVTKRIDEVDQLLKQENESLSPEQELAVGDSEEAEQELQQSISEYSTAFSFNSSEVKVLYATVSNRAQRYLDLELAERQATKSREALLQELAELEQKKKESVIQLTAPHAGIFVPAADGLEAILQPGRLDQVDLQAVWVARDQQRVVHGSWLEKGELVYKIVKDGPWFLIVETNVKSADELEQASDIEIVVDEMKLSGALNTTVTIDENAYCLFAMQGPPVLLERYYTADLKIDTQKGVEIPAAALMENSEGHFVKVVTDDGAEERSVSLLARKKDLVLVEGIPENTEVLIIEGKR